MPQLRRRNNYYGFYILASKKNCIKRGFFIITGRGAEGFQNKLVKNKIVFYYSLSVEINRNIILPESFSVKYTSGISIIRSKPVLPK